MKRLAERKNFFKKLKEENGWKKWKGKTIGLKKKKKKKWHNAHVYLTKTNFRYNRDSHSMWKN